ncbi:ArgJ-like domain-containing protein [Dunaliella salina]|uniref:Arginine biosynthesis bifunctional protein ArgJ, chloroplastic n=1 Tax=Dunaliella salina TaxID=3046 RepID=A0ABQ7H0Q6_DUNSA|nr:ArgJ-like domain-containing protein [Dunaliella salina]|eukprot:KAF5840425.1 ArgJ-like domain-containing protein [Dunaliella salina]
MHCPGKQASLRQRAKLPSPVAHTPLGRAAFRVANKKRSGSAMAAISMEPESFVIPAVPDLTPDGDWEKILTGGVCTPKGFKAAGVFAGLRASGKKADLALVLADTDAVVGGTFTQNVMCAAPCLYCKEVMGRKDTVRAVLTNAGQANAATGEQGYKDALECAAAMADALGVSRDDIMLQSTGVIGRRMKMENFIPAIPEIAKVTIQVRCPARHGVVHVQCIHVSVFLQSLWRVHVHWVHADLVSKSGALRVMVGGKPVHIGGMCKGSGMIHPNMATMLGVVTCDAAVTPEVWRGMVKRASIASFNQITVDGDTSTNDCVIGLASGAAGTPLISDANSADGKQLEAALTALLQGLAKSIAWDGEGATCLLEVECVGARTDAEARQADLGVQMGSMPLMAKGQPLDFDKAAANQYLKETCGKHGTVYVKVTVGQGAGRGFAWGCDLSYDYVKINAEYTT